MLTCPKVTYPIEGSTFTIDDFRRRAESIPEYYLHVVNDKTGVCKRLDQTYDFEGAQKMYRIYASLCKPGWHIELTIAISAGEVRSRLR